MRCHTTLAATLWIAAACAEKPSRRGTGSAEAGGGPSPVANTSTARGDGATGVEDARLQALLIAHWEATLKYDPLFATRLGDHRYDDQLPDRSIQAREDMKALRRGWLASARTIAKDEHAESPSDQATLSLFIENIESEIEGEVCAFEDWTLSPTENPVTFANELAELHGVRTVQDSRNLIARYRGLPRLIDAEIANLRRGAGLNLFANAESTRRVIAMVEDQLRRPSTEWAMLEPTKKKMEGWAPSDAKSFESEITLVVEEDVRPSLARYLDVVRKEILPSARDEARSGLLALPFGKPCYDARIRTFTTMRTSAGALHEMGKKEIDRINREMQILGQGLFGTDDLGKILERLRSDRALYFKTPQEIEEKASRALDNARSRISDYFGILPQADCTVRRIPDYEAPFTTIAYYRPPVPDGTKPGEYFVNVHEPPTRPRYEAEALAFHESIPGHHLQIAIAQEREALPAFRKHLGMTAFVEGWALYAEELADEMHLYSSDIDRMGMLSYQAWRASRLVVDTGIHAMGWSRQAARGYLLAHTALAANNIDNEVDRYIVWPGQALAYKTGQLEIRRLRQRAEAELGAAFDLKSFHDVVLARGAVSLSVLQDQVEAWIRTKRD